MQRTLLPPPSPSGAAQLSRRTAVTAGLVSILPVLRPDLARANPVSPDSPAYQAISPQGPTFPKPLPDVSEIYAEYKYARPLDVLPFVYDHAAMGDPEAVLQAIDTFSLAFPMFKIGAEKGEILDRLVTLSQPKLAVELGSFIGYSAVRIARLLPPGSRLVCVEANPECVRTMEEVLKYAGLRDRVVIESGLSDKVVPTLADTYGPAQLLFEDHCKPCYLRDLETAERTGLLETGAWTIADNVLVPIPLTEYVRRLRDPDQYEGLLVQAKYEYEQRWNPEWETLMEDRQDAMSIAVRVAGMTDTQRRAARAQLQQLCQQLGAERCRLLPVLTEEDADKELPKLLAY